MQATLLMMVALSAPALLGAQASTLIGSRAALPQHHSEPVPATPGIQDNSFLIEEAYNQETGVVQHIGTYRVQRGTSDFDAVFTQEWPVGSILHQLSYEVPLVRAGASPGIGDIGLNYRYQLVGDGGTSLAVAPRVSLVLPTGDWKRGRGLGAAGVDLNLPVSYVLSRTIVTHFNAGLALTPSARNAAGDRATFSEFSIGQSLILTAHPNVQPMLEIAYAIGNDVIGESRTARTEALLISPGVRAAFNLASGLQIVPGVAVPIGAGPSSGDRGVFVYLSFEHAFRQ